MNKKLSDFINNNMSSIIAVLLAFSGVFSGYKILEYRVSQLEQSGMKGIDYKKIEEMVDRHAQERANEIVILIRDNFEKDIKNYDEIMDNLRRDLEAFKTRQTDFNTKAEGDIRVIRQILVDKIDAKLQNKMNVK